MTSCTMLGIVELGAAPAPASDQQCADPEALTMELGHVEKGDPQGFIRASDVCDRLVLIESKNARCMLDLVAKVDIIPIFVIVEFMLKLVTGRVSTFM
jgi:hypothetical protein